MAEERGTGPRLRLARLTAGDAATVAGWYADPEFLRLVDATATSPRDVAQVLADIAEDAASDDSFRYGLRVLTGDGLIGQGSLHDIVWPRRAGWLSLALSPARWGQGYGREALGLLLQEAFDHLGLELVQLSVYDYNARARALYTRQGFRQEGVLRRFRAADGSRHGALLMTLTAEDWRAGQRPLAPTAGPVGL